MTHHPLSIHYWGDSQDWGDSQIPDFPHFPKPENMGVIGRAHAKYMSTFVVCKNININFSFIIFVIIKLAILIQFYLGIPKYSGIIR